MVSEGKLIKTTIYLSQEQVDFLDKMAQEEGINRRKIVQSIFDDHLAFYMTWKIFTGFGGLINERKPPQGKTTRKKDDKNKE